MIWWCLYSIQSTRDIFQNRFFKSIKPLQFRYFWWPKMAWNDKSAVLYKYYIPCAIYLYQFLDTTKAVGKKWRHLTAVKKVCHHYHERQLQRRIPIHIIWEEIMRKLHCLWHLNCKLLFACSHYFKEMSKTGSKYSKQASS